MFFYGNTALGEMDIISVFETDGGSSILSSPAKFTSVVQRIGYHATNVGTVVRFHPGVPINGVADVVVA